MTLTELSKLVTAIKTSTTHLGAKHEEIEITFNGGMSIYEVKVSGPLPGGTLDMSVEV